MSFISMDNSLLHPPLFKYDFKDTVTQSDTNYVGNDLCITAYVILCEEATLKVKEEMQ